MAKTERIYNVPLRKGFLKAKRYKKSKKAVTTLREFIVRHMKCSLDQVKIGKVVNEHIWERGIKNPPHHVKVTAIKSDDGIVKVELFGFKYQEPVESKSKADKGKKADEASEKASKEEKPASKPKKAKKDTEVEAEIVEDESSDEGTDESDESEEKPKKKAVKKSPKKDDSEDKSEPKKEKPKKTSKPKD